MFYLYEQTIVIKEFLEKTLFTADPQKQKLFLGFYVESFLTEEEKNKKNRFEKENILKKLLEADHFEKTFSAIENDFYDLKKNFHSTNLPQVEPEYNFFYHLHHLVTFDFDLFFSKVNSSFHSKMLKAPTVNNLRGTKIVNELKDFYYTIATLTKKINPEKSIEQLWIRAKGEDGKVWVKKTQDTISNAYKILQSDLSPEIILNLIRYIESSPKLKIKTSSSFISILHTHRKEMYETFLKTKEIVLQLYSEKSMKNEIVKLFGSDFLLPIPGYNEELISLLEEKGNSEIKAIKGVKLLKTFILKVYEENYREIINTFLIEGFFIDKDFQTSFADAYFQINGLKNLYQEFETDMNSSTSNSFKTLLTLLISSKTIINSNKIQMTTEIINEKILIIQKKGAEILHRFGKELFTALNEYKLPKPEKISNIRSLKGAGNREFISSMVDFYKRISLYLKLSQTFIYTEKK